LHFSTKINKKDKINQFKIIEFQRAIQKLEILTNITEDGDLEDKDILKKLEGLYFEYGNANELNLSTKNSFLSPGNTWSDIPGDDRKLRILAFTLGLLFSAQVDAIDDIHLSEEQMNYITASVSAMKDEGNFDVIKEGIMASLDQPNHIVKELEAKPPKISEKITFPKLKAEGDIGV